MDSQTKANLLAMKTYAQTLNPSFQINQIVED